MVEEEEEEDVGNEWGEEFFDEKTWRPRMWLQKQRVARALWLK